MFQIVPNSPLIEGFVRIKKYSLRNCDLFLRSMEMQCAPINVEGNFMTKYLLHKHNLK